MNAYIIEFIFNLYNTTNKYYIVIAVLWKRSYAIWSNTLPLEQPGSYYLLYLIILFEVRINKILFSTLINNFDIYLSTTFHFRKYVLLATTTKIMRSKFCSYPYVILKLYNIPYSTRKKKCTSLLGPHNLQI